MRIGEYLFEDVDFMEEEELDALEEAINIRRNQIALRLRFLEKVKGLIEEMKSEGYQLVFSNNDLWVNLSCGDNTNHLKVEDKEDWV